MKYSYSSHAPCVVVLDTIWVFYNIEIIFNVTLPWNKNNNLFHNHKIKLNLMILIFIFQFFRIKCNLKSFMKPFNYTFFRMNRLNKTIIIIAVIDFN